MYFDWHSGYITRDTSIDTNYKNTQNVRRFMCAQCGSKFMFDRDFMAWIRNGEVKNMGEVVDEWKRRNANF